VYSITYQLCDKTLPTANCAIIADTITVTANIAPVSDSGTATAGLVSAPIANVAANDFVNGVAAVLGTNATIAQSGTWPTGISLNTATGAVSTTAAVLPGTYTAQYNLCDKTLPTANCALATVTITVNGNIAPAPESGTAISGTPSSPIANVASNDFVNGFAAILGINAAVTQSGTWPTGITLNTATGAISTTAAVQPGSYSLIYQLCDKATPTPNCATTTDTITVTANIAPVTENGSAVSGTASTPIPTVAANDFVNGAAAILGSNATVATSGTWPTGITLNTATGAISTTAAVQPGSYTVTYQLCDKTAPTANCAVMTDTITVTANIAPFTESGTAVSGTAATPIANVASNDQVNGFAAVLNTNAIIAQSGTWATGISLNTATGAVSTTAAVQPGIYPISYQLCDKSLPTANCATIADQITVTANIAPVDDSGTAIAGTPSTPISNVAANDFVNGVAAVIGTNASVAVSGIWTTGFSLNSTTGAISTTAAVAPGVYTMQYNLCDTNSPQNCALATLTITVNGNINPNCEYRRQ
jgi:hypothetical protein